MALSTVILLLATFGGFFVVFCGFARMKEETTEILDHYEKMLVEARDAEDEEALLQDEVTDETSADAQEPL